MKKEELEALRAEILEGVLIRSKAKWIGEGEKMSKYFCNLENRHYVSKRMTSLIKDNDEEIDNNEDILTEVKSFYEKLYESTESFIEDVNLSTILKEETPKLTEEEKQTLSGPITYTEAAKVLKNMRNYSSPGSDGYTAAFLKYFFKDIGHFLIKSINHSFEKNILSITQREGLITCIPKPGKSKKQIKNWRPITLLNVTYKIASGCIAQRIKSVLPRVISTDQSGFMAGRCIGDNIRLMYDVLFQAKTTKVPGLLLLIDFEKAFDSVAWSFINKALRYFNFGEDIIKWINLFNTEIKSRVIVNNTVSEWFPVERGCRQGDPLSPYIFLIVGEILAHMIRQKDSIKGYKIKGVEVLISQYADDTSLFLDGSENSFKQSVEALTKFAKYSGLKINSEKTKVIWFGNPRPPETQYLPELNFDWNPGTFTLLGVQFTTDLKDICDKNIRLYINTMKAQIKNWSKRNLTPFGKITVIKSIIIAKIIHILMPLPNPTTKIVKELQTLLNDFLWGGKSNKIKKQISNQTIDRGGLNMVNLEQFINALKVTWFRRFLNEETKWKTLLMKGSPKFKLVYKVGPAIAEEVHHETRNPFWKDSLKAFLIYSKNTKVRKLEEFESCSFIYNQNIKIGGNIITHRLLIEQDITQISKLKDNHQYISFDEFKAKYPHNNIDFVTFRGIITAIKKYENTLTLKHTQTVGIKTQPHLYTIFKTSKGASNIYKILIHTDVKIKGITTWEKRFQTKLDQPSLFTKLLSTTKDTTLRWFQFRILHNILTTNKSVNRYNKEQNENCTFCNRYPESIEHLFWQCEITQGFWENLVRIINTKCKHAHNLKINKKFIILGSTHNIKTDSVLDLIILLAKHFIYKSKVNKIKPTIKHFEYILHKRFLIEKCISTTQAKQMHFKTAWNPYMNMINSLSTTTPQS